jgi:hypothetical protein
MGVEAIILTEGQEVGTLGTIHILGEGLVEAVGKTAQEVKVVEGDEELVEQVREQSEEADEEEEGTEEGAEEDKVEETG